MARNRKTTGYQFEDNDQDSTITLGEDERGTLDVDSLEDKQKKATLQSTPDSELFDDLPNSPFKSSPGDDGLERQDEDDEDEHLETELDDEDEDDEPAAREEEQEGELEEDELRPSKSWRKRLLRQERLLTETREETRSLADRNRALEKALKNKQSDEEFETKKVELQEKVNKVRESLEIALEEGTDSKKIARLTEDLADAKGDLKAEEVLAKQRRQADEEAPAVNRQPRLAAQWMRKHGRFNTDTVFQATAKAVDRQVAGAGFDPETEEYYQELDKRLKKLYPDEYKGGARREEREEPRRRKAPSQDLGRDQGGTRNKRPQSADGFTRRGNKVIVSAQQKTNMRRFGLDPDNVDDLKTYVRENIRG